MSVIIAEEPPFLQCCWYVAAWSDDVSGDAPFGCMIAGQPIVLYRRRDGAAVALADRCPHRFAPLSVGRVEGDDIRCGYHGIRFDATGVCREIPNQDTIPPQCFVRAYPVVERHSWLWVWLGDPSQANPGLIPAAVGLDDPDWDLRHGAKTFAANYVLMHDNLLDLSHLAYVHPTTLGRGAPAWGAGRPAVERLARGLRVSRWLPDGLMRIAGAAAPQAVDQWNTYDFLAPGVFLLRNETHPAGSAAASGGQRPTTAPLQAVFSSQAVTPVDERHTRYFYSIGPRACDSVPGFPERFFAMTDAAFEEDSALLREQQRIIDASPGLKMLPLAGDMPAQTMRRIMAQLKAAERGVG